jgi:hypothetical protein
MVWWLSFLSEQFPCQMWWFNEAAAESIQEFLCMQLVATEIRAVVTYILK